MSEYRITAGFMPLTDSLLLVIAQEKKFALTEGIELTLVKESSWANIRDRTAIGHFDVAHMLAPMPIAASLGLTPIAAAMVAPMAFGLGGNAVTVSTALWDRMAAAGAPVDFEAAGVGAALRQVLAAGGPRPKFAVVHPFSGHNYELRYWLAACGIDPDRDVEIVILPPPLMPDALAAGGIDGYCVGEPWNSVGVAAGAGRIATVKAAIWRASPEKVLGMTERWAAHNPESLAALLRALYRAALWCADSAHHAEAATIMSAPNYLGQPAALVQRALSGRIAARRGEDVEVTDFFVPHAGSATFPWASHALWFYSQMVRWGDVPHTPQNARIAAACYRPDLYRAAVAPFGASLPTSDSRPVSAGDFFDGRVFDSAHLDDYIWWQSPKS